LANEVVTSRLSSARRLSGEDAGVISIVRDHNEKALRACWRVFPTLHRPEELIYILDVLDAEWQGVLATGLDWWVEKRVLLRTRSGTAQSHRWVLGSQVWGMSAGCRLPGLHGSSWRH